MTDYLIHYGVKGMKWGVRNDYVPKGRTRKTAKKDTGVIDVIGEDNAYTLAAYATIAAAVLAYKGGKRLSDLHKQGWFKEKYKPSDIKRVKTNKQHDLKVINPIPGVSESVLRDSFNGKSLYEFSEKERKALISADKNGWLSNCVYCSTASALRRKGYDVEAKNSPGRGHPVGQTLGWWKGSAAEDFFGHRANDSKDAKKLRANAKIADVERAEKILSRQGVGAYGDLRMWSLFSAHSVEYSVEKDGVMIYDNQYKLSMPIKEYVEKSWLEPGVFIRLDNCSPDLDAMLKDHVIKPRGR